MTRTLHDRTKAHVRLVGQSFLVLLALVSTALSQIGDQAGPSNPDYVTPVRPATNSTAGNPPVATVYPDPATAGQQVHFDVAVATAADEVLIAWAAKHKADIERVNVERHSQHPLKWGPVRIGGTSKPPVFASMFGSETPVSLLFNAEIRQSLFDRLQDDKRTNILMTPAVSTHWHQTATVDASSSADGEKTLGITLKPTPIGKGEMSLEISAELPKRLVAPLQSKLSWSWNLRARSNHTLLIPVMMRSPEGRLVLLVQPKIIAQNPAALAVNPQAVPPQNPYATQPRETPVSATQQAPPVAVQQHVVRGAEVVQITANVLVTKAEFIPDEPVELDRKQLDASMKQVNADSATINHRLQMSVRFGDEARMSPPYPVGEKCPYDLRIRPRKSDEGIALELHAKIAALWPGKDTETDVRMHFTTKPNMTMVLPLPIRHPDGRKVAILLQPSPMPVATPIRLRQRTVEYFDANSPRSTETAAVFQMLLLEADAEIVRKVIGDTRTTDEKLSEIDVEKPGKGESKKRHSTKLKTHLRTFLMNGTTSKLFVADLRKQDESFRVLSRPQVRTLLNVSAALSIHGGASPSDPKAGLGKLDIFVKPKKSGEDIFAETTLKFSGPGKTTAPDAWTPGLTFEVFASQKCVPGQTAAIVVGGGESDRATMLLTDVVTLEEVEVTPARSLAVGTPVPAAEVPVWRKADSNTATISGFQFRGVARQQSEKTSMRLVSIQAVTGSGVTKGDVVDVLLVSTDVGNPDSAKIETLCESVAVSETARPSLDSTASVTLLVEKELVEKLLLAQIKGTLRLSVHRSSVQNSGTPNSSGPYTPVTRNVSSANEWPVYPGSVIKPSTGSAYPGSITKPSPYPVRVYQPVRPGTQVIYTEDGTWQVMPQRALIPISGVQKPTKYVKAPPVSPTPKPKSDVQQVLEEVREMRKLIQGLREDMDALRNSVRPNQETSQQTNDWRQDEQTHIARPQIEQALKKEVSIDIEDGTLNEALKQLHDAAGVNITIDPGAIDDTGITTDERVSLHLAGVSLRSALKILLTPFRLTTLTEDEVLKVVSQQFAEGKLFVVAYQAEDLIQTNKDGEPEFESLIDLITNVVAPESWQVVGGLGALASNPTTTTLVIRQTQRIHGEIQQLFDALRQWNSDDPSVISTNEQPPILQQMMRRGAIVSGPQPPQQIGRTSYAETNPLHQVVSIDQKDEKARRRVAASGELHRRTTGD